MAHNDVQRGLGSMDAGRWEAQTLIRLIDIGNAQMDAERDSRRR